MRKDIEHTTQVACVRWFRLAHPHLLIFAIPNGGARNAMTGARLKDEGVTAGIPDLFIAAPSGGKSGLFVEMKTQTGTLSHAQKAVHPLLISSGYAVEVCRSFDDFRRVVDAYLNA